MPRTTYQVDNALDVQCGDILTVDAEDGPRKVVDVTQYRRVEGRDPVRESVPDLVTQITTTDAPPEYRRAGMGGDAP